MGILRKIIVLNLLGIMRTSILYTILFCTIGLVACGDEPIELAEPRAVDPKIVLEERQFALQVGNTSTVMASYVTADSRTENPSLTWTVDDESIAEVDQNGQITAKALGQTTAQASLDRATSHPILITVVSDAGDLARIDMVPDTVFTERGLEYTLDFTAWTLDGNRIENPNAVWSTSNPSVGSINDQGQAQSIERGVSEMEVTIDGIRSLAVPFSVYGEVKTGQFSGLGDYSAAGEVTLVQLPEGGNELRFSDNFFVDAGPQLDVYLSKTNRVDGNSIKLGLLSAFRGGQNFFVSANTIFDDVAFVIIHCTTYDLPFGRATMR